MAKQRIYTVQNAETGALIALVRASSQQRALKHVVGKQFDVNVADQEAIVFGMSNGVKVEDADEGDDTPAADTGTAQG